MVFTWFIDLKIGLLQYPDLPEVCRRNANLFLKLPDKSLLWRLGTLTVSANEVPGIWIEALAKSTSAQENLVLP